MSRSEEGLAAALLSITPDDMEELTTAVDESLTEVEAELGVA